MSLNDLEPMCNADGLDGNVSKRPGPLRVVQFDANGSGYAPRIKDEEWEQYHDIVDQLEAKGYSRRSILRTLQASHGFSPTYAQLNARMTQWQRSKTKCEAAPLRESTNRGGKSSALQHPAFATGRIESGIDLLIDTAASKPTDKSHIIDSLPAIDWDVQHDTNDMDIDETSLFTTIAEQRQIPSGKSEADSMSISSESSCSSDFAHFRRFAKKLKDKPAAKYYPSGGSSGSSHSSWGFERVTGYPIASMSDSRSQRPSRRIRSGVVVEAKHSNTKILPSRKRREVVIHQEADRLYDLPRRSDMISGRWR